MDNYSLQTKVRQPALGPFPWTVNEAFEPQMSKCREEKSEYDGR